MFQVVGCHRPTTVGEARHLLATGDRVALAGGRRNLAEALGDALDGVLPTAYRAVT